MSAPSLAVPPPGSRFARRLSSVEASRENIQMGPTVVVPPQHLMAPSAGSEIATGFEAARHRLESVGSPVSPGVTPPETSVTDKYAFAFDIDGVLIRGGRPIPDAQR
jgi:hypothetical protein